MVRVAFGLGSNVGNREAMLAQAIKQLSALNGLDATSLHCSSIHENEALLPEGAPPEWNRPFLNQVITLEGERWVASEPERLLDAVKTIEQRLGRIDRGRWGPREIDIDLIAIEGVQYHSECLTLPHPQAHLRPFVTEPLTEIWPDALLVS